MLICGAGEFVEFNGQLVDKQWRDTNHPNAVGWKGYRTLSDIQVVPSANQDRSPCQWWGYNFGLPSTIQNAKIEFTLWIAVGYTSKSYLEYAYNINKQDDNTRINLHGQNGGYTDGVTTGNVGVKTITLGKLTNPMIYFKFANHRYGSNIQGYLRNVKVWYN